MSLRANARFLRQPTKVLHESNLPSALAPLAHFHTLMPLSSHSPPLTTHFQPHGPLGTTDKLPARPSALAAPSDGNILLLDVP